ncbi:MAG: hypothetical protein CM15mP49_25150 [Actinomycetota bacterium]|nr:MAG: hypothetical protein CM15mP49_25150 [Actinomycetota bacterium]
MASYRYGTFSNTAAADIRSMQERGTGSSHTALAKMPVLQPCTESQMGSTFAFQQVDSRNCLTVTETMISCSSFSINASVISKKNGAEIHLVWVLTRIHLQTPCT